MSYSNRGGTAGSAESPMLNSLLTEAEWATDITTLSSQMADALKYNLAQTEKITSESMYIAAARTLQRRLVDRFNRTQFTIKKKSTRRAIYMSLEWLLGRAFTNNLLNTDLEEKFSLALTQLGYSVEQMAEEEIDAGLGNGGLGRLAACFIDSWATHDLPVTGYGLYYRYGMFRQVVDGGHQVEEPDFWLRRECPWTVRRHEINYPVRFYGYAKSEQVNGRFKFTWEGAQVVNALAHDFLIPGFDTETVTNIRLWEAQPSQESEFHLQSHNAGNYIEAVRAKQESQNITAVLYPNDKTGRGRILRLKQEYLFVSATIQDLCARCQEEGISMKNFSEFHVIQLNDTHPVLAVPELMRVLLDDYEFEWEEAWEVVRKSFAYTNHTILPEALETWKTTEIRELLPRHYDIVTEINRRWLLESEEWLVQNRPAIKQNSTEWNDWIAAVSIFTPHGDYVRMANLAVVSSFRVNGVAAIHSDIVRDRLFKEYVAMSPKDKFINITNGVTPRRWMNQANPLLTALLTNMLEPAGVKTPQEWIKHLEMIAAAEKSISEETLQEFVNIKAANKLRLIEYLEEHCGENLYGAQLNPSAIFDIQVKRIHEYKRQLMNILSVIARWHELSQMSPEELKKVTPAFVLIAGKAASGYDTAKNIISLINGVAHKINTDPKTSSYLTVAFVPNYCVSNAEIIIPACDLSEQISTAGFEASGTGNMKFVMNGALIIGTLDGANVEIREEIGDDNFFLFGLDAEEVNTIHQSNGYFSPEIPTKLGVALSLIRSGVFNLPDAEADFVNRATPDLISLCDIVSNTDYYLITKDFEAYHNMRWNDVPAKYRNPRNWAESAIRAVCRMSKFSSDRSAQEYASSWGISAVDVSADTKTYLSVNLESQTLPAPPAGVHMPKAPIMTGSEPLPPRVPTSAKRSGRRSGRRGSNLKKDSQ